MPLLTADGDHRRTLALVLRPLRVGRLPPFLSVSSWFAELDSGLLCISDLDIRIENNIQNLIDMDVVLDDSFRPFTPFRRAAPASAFRLHRWTLIGNGVGRLAMLDLAP